MQDVGSIAELTLSCIHVLLIRCLVACLHDAYRLGLDHYCMDSLLRSPADAAMYTMLK